MSSRSAGPLKRVICVFVPLFHQASSKTQVRCSQREQIPKLAEACYRFTPDIALRKGSSGNEAIFLDVTKCLGLYKEESLLQRIDLLAARMNVYPRMTVADDVPTALAMARFRVASARKLPVAALYDYACPFEHDPAQIKKVTKMIETMKKLGVETLLDFAGLPAGTLSSRFGSEGAQLALRIRRSYDQPWPKFQPPERLHERLSLEETEGLQPCAQLDSLLFLSKRLIDPIMARLRGRGMRASSIEVVFEQEPYSLLLETKRKWHFDLPIPQGSVLGLMPILRDTLSFELQKRPLQAPVVSIEFEVREMAPGHGVQKNFFDRRDEQNEAWDILVGRLCQKLGSEKTFRAQEVNRHLPERAWKRDVQSLDSKKDSTSKRDLAGAVLSAGVLPPRPSRLLSKPQRLIRLGEFLFHSKNRKRYWKTTKWSGPERMNGEWWRDPETQEGYLRNYYQVETQQGESLWVYQTKDSVPYLHGFFD